MIVKCSWSAFPVRLCYIRIPGFGFRHIFEQVILNDSWSHRDLEAETRMSSVYLRPHCTEVKNPVKFLHVLFKALRLQTRSCMDRQTSQNRTTLVANCQRRHKKDVYVLVLVMVKLCGKVRMTRTADELPTVSLLLILGVSVITSPRAVELFCKSSVESLVFCGTLDSTVRKFRTPDSDSGHKKTGL